MELLGLLLGRRKHAVWKTVGVSLLGLFLPVLTECLPRRNTRPSLQSNKHVAAVNGLDLSAPSAKSSSDHCLVFNRTERTCGVNKSSSLLQKLQTSHQDVELQWMQSQSISDSPVFPNSEVLSHGTITSTWDVTQNSVKLNVVSVLGKLHFREKLSIVVHNHKVRRVQPFHLMHKHMRPLVIRIVGNNNTCWLGTSTVEGLDQLGGLGTWRSTHVHHEMVWLHVQKERRNHRNSLLTGNISNLGLNNQELLSRSV
ncbi:hypothetical protein OGAPHI_001646 [Ogataea philodendri]|uniref:Uncharacterized protein n=1 Tax=Ogataea philodendri TaxID=1378263 RepID=A0A9P8T8B9_9ASCO|nr:uncharacterized protein OGAPHI_001646 [Ogataea philodendri]KAH3669050.1 hypothetical protein OGAPHI_001646 [Ogataea philodendri]